MLFLDIETKFDPKYKDIYTANIHAPLNYKDEQKILQYVEAKKLEAESAMALDQDFSKIMCIGVLESGMALDNKEENLDVARLVSFEELCRLLDFHWLVTFNGKSFDLPIILKSAVKLGLSKDQFPYQKVKESLKKYATFPHRDMMEILSMNGVYKSQDTYMQVYLGKAKKPIDFATCTQEELEQHCLDDAADLFELYKKFEFMF